MECALLVCLHRRWMLCVCLPMVAALHTDPLSPAIKLFPPTHCVLLDDVHLYAAFWLPCSGSIWWAFRRKSTTRLVGPRNAFCGSLPCLQCLLIIFQTVLVDGCSAGNPFTSGLVLYLAENRMLCRCHPFLGFFSRDLPPSKSSVCICTLLDRFIWSLLAFGQPS